MTTTLGAAASRSQTPDRTEPAGRRYVQFVIVLGALIALGPLTIDMYLPAFPEIADDLNASDSQIQLTLTGMLLGLAVGQLVIGPLSDAFGRRRPLMVGLGVHALASLLCSLAPSAEMLASVRVLQGFAGAAVSVTAMAMVRDQFEGIAMARLMARLILVIGLAPIIAPTLGGVVLTWSGWRTIFLVIMVAAVALIGVAAFGLRETLPPERRQPARVRASLTAYGALLRDRRFLALGLIGGAMMATLFAYVAGASFVLQDGFGLSEGEFAVVFGINAATFVLGSQINPLLLRRFGLIQVLTGAILMTLGSSLVLLTLGLTGWGGLAVVVVPLAANLGLAGFAMPNTPALALANYGASAGTAAAVLGCLQFGVGGAIAPVVGAFGSTTVVPMASVMVGLTATAALLMFGVVRRSAPAPASASASRG
ncbi:multidrug effflux MFS transporter [Nocardioides speluncae]|uniref:multidrug effflux MFS transporter n=1 Tax=Nocardioides speluncae TaxID=2670337 RepID=UPI000D687D16|nr:multidrug effflux MFS transporter [Nocardioides speluncae]